MGAAVEAVLVLGPNEPLATGWMMGACTTALGGEVSRRWNVPTGVCR